MKKEAEVKTSIGELVGYFDGFYLIDKGEEGAWLTEEEYETVKYPELNPLEARQYEILMHKRDKVEALIKLMYDVIGFDEKSFKPFPCEAAKEQYYRLVEAIVKGGCNKW